MTNLVDRRAPLPLYHQLKQALVDDIERRGLTAGDRLPTEAEIERRYRVSRSTIRQALRDLVVEGVVERIQGKGTFVAGGHLTHVPLLTSFTENMRAQGHTPSRRVLESRVAVPPPGVATVLGLEADGQRCRFLRRLLSADGQPVGVAETWLPVAVLGAHDDLFDPARLESGSLYDLLQSPPIGLVLHRGVETVRSGLADADHARLLGCEPGAAVLVVDRLTHTPQDRPVEATRMVFAGGRYEYRVEMFRP